MRLWHYTCDHGADGIRRDGVLKPHGVPDMGPPLVWLTDLDVPIRAGLGLTSHILSCDRMKHRFAVDVDETAVVWWPRFARRMPPWVRAGLEGVPGALPAHWWVAESPLPVVVGALAPP